VVFENTLVTGGQGTRVKAFDSATGRPRWEGFAGFQGETAGQSISGQATFVDDLVLVPAMASLAAMNSQTGEIIWHCKARQILSSPLVFEDLVFFGAGDKHLTAADIKTGRKKWRIDLKAEVGSAAFAEGLLYVRVGRSLCAIDPETRSVRWSLDRERSWQIDPTACDGLVLATGPEGFCAVDGRSGEVRWTWQENLLPALGSCAAVSSGTVVFRDLEGTFRALDLQTGEQKWKFTEPEAQPYVSGSPVIAGELVYIIGGKDDDSNNETDSPCLYALNLNDGSVRWTINATDCGLEGRFLNSFTPFVSEGVIYVAGNDELVALASS
jgi:outer membrane protein assembly factor BamB